MHGIEGGGVMQFLGIRQYRTLFCFFKPSLLSMKNRSKLAIPVNMTRFLPFLLYYQLSPSQTCMTATASNIDNQYTVKRQACVLSPAVSINLRQCLNLHVYMPKKDDS